MQPLSPRNYSPVSFLAGLPRAASLVLVASFALLAACESASTSVADWSGTYVYRENIGTMAGVAYIDYKLELGHGTCRLTMQGLQTDEDIVCVDSHEANVMTVRFKQYQNGQLVNAFGTQVYQPNQPLFSISRGSGSALITQWAGLAPDTAKAASGDFFQKTG